MIIRISNANLPGVGNIPWPSAHAADKGMGGIGAPKGKTGVIREDVVNQLNEHPKG
jgi:hypothetical protein